MLEWKKHEKNTIGQVKLQTSHFVTFISLKSYLKTCVISF